MIAISFFVFFATAVVFSAAALMSSSDWYQHRRALRQLRYEAEIRALARALREGEDQ